ncbi:PAS domain S-box protein [Polaromonas sp.]|uniref:PAS domain S-box protein n=1 Tax=Polaromonas sp. TaxID=1869339 RepID=UPI003567A3B7
MKVDEAQRQALQRLQAEALELARANNSLQLELAGKNREIESLSISAQTLRSLVAISADWHWEQDAEHRFVNFTAEHGAVKVDIERDKNLGKCRWELAGAVPLSSSWEAHRALLDAHQPFRNFEYMRVLGDGLTHYLSVSGVPVFNTENRFLGYQGTVHDISAIKRSEEAERQAARFVDNVVDNIPLAFHLKSVHDGYKVVAWNKAAELLYGVPREAALGRTMHDLWPKADVDRMHAADLELVAAGVPQDLPDRLAVTRNRGTIHVHMRKVPMKDASGVVTHILITAGDITQRLAAESQLLHNQERFRSLTELSADWYWETDKQFRFTELSGGETPEERATIDGYLGKTRWEIDTRAANRTLWDKHKRQLEQRETFRELEYERVGPDGTLEVLCISGASFLSPAGQFAGYRGVGSNITARKLTEIALRASETRFRAVVAALAEGVVLRDASGQIIDCNASAERILGKTLVQIKGQTIVAPEWEVLREDGSLMPPDEVPSVKARRTGKAQPNEVICYRKPDGNTLWVQINVQPLFENGTGVPTGYVTTITDIGKRKRDELEIVRLNVDLENRVSRRTAQLEAVNRELEAFSYSVAHDLRSPLSSIDGFSALLQKALASGSNERANHYLARIRSGAQRMGELTDGLLSLAQLSRTSLHWKSLDISAEAGQLLRQHAERDPGRQVQTVVEPCVQVRGDTALLRQVLDNLIGNAWKFTSKTPKAQILVGMQGGTNQQPVYFVRDNGAGFDMAYADKLFGTFQRLHSPEEFSGSGIGLATVKRIITRHGGRIWADSAVGEGSTFYFTLGSEQLKAKPGDDAGFALVGPPRASHLPGSAGPTGAASATSLSGNDNDAFTFSDQQFSNAFDHSAIGMALVAVDSRRLRVNSVFCQILGYSEAEMLSRTIYDVTHPDDIEYDVLQRKRALAGEIETYQWEKRYFHKSGRIVWAHLSCSLVRDADRRPLHFISQIQDITERKQTEQILRDNEARFRALTELSSDWFWEQDENFRFVQISGRTSNMSGLDDDGVIGKTRWELVDLVMKPDAWLAHQALLERHEAFRDFEIVRKDSDGKLRYESISGLPIFDASGRFSGYHGTGRDTTEIRQVHDALRASESQLRDITDTLPAHISYVDSSQRFRFHNWAYAEGLGLSHDQIHGRQMRDVLGEEGYELARPSVEEVLSGYPVVFERHRKTPQGDMRDFIVNYFPRYGDGEDIGRVIGFYSLGTDVTELKRIDRMKSEFVSTVSHELRTPLTSMRGSLGLISGGLAGQLPDAVKTLVEIARSNCERLIRLIDDILDIEKIESGKMRLDLQVIELKPLLVQALAANQGFGATRQVGLNLVFPDGHDLRVNADSDRLNQVVTNLLSNAMKFSPPGALVDVRVLHTGARVRVEVSDRGPGIPEESHKRIFQKFSQADSSDTRQKGGTGLGLNIARAIIERLGGSIGFDTEPGVGTTFFFELPQWQEPAIPTADTASRPASCPPGAAGASLRPRVLISARTPPTSRA